MKAYLDASEFIDWDTSAVLDKAHVLADGLTSVAAIAQRCFEFVRDDIQHSGDFKRNPVTCKASAVLKYRTGYCYAKSHLLAALLRANRIPAGLCYQRLTITDVPPFCLHGLNAVYLAPFGWYRMDARGNKPGVTAEFCPPVECLAFALVHEGEADLPEVWAEPLPMITALLNTGKDYRAISRNLPDIAIISTK